jgi:hypothetical protein
VTARRLCTDWTAACSFLIMDKGASQAELFLRLDRREVVDGVRPLIDADRAGLERRRSCGQASLRPGQPWIQPGSTAECENLT